MTSYGQDTWAIQQYVWHKNITHTVLLYMVLSPEGFKSFWKD